MCLQFSDEMLISRRLYSLRKWRIFNNVEQWDNWCSRFRIYLTFTYNIWSVSFICKWKFGSVCMRDRKSAAEFAFPAEWASRILKDNTLSKQFHKEGWMLLAWKNWFKLRLTIKTRIDLSRSRWSVQNCLRQTTELKISYFGQKNSIMFLGKISNQKILGRRFSLFDLFDQSSNVQSLTQIQWHENLHRKEWHTEGFV